MSNVTGDHYSTCASPTRPTASGNAQGMHESEQQGARNMNTLMNSEKNSSKLKEDTSYISIINIIILIIACCFYEYTLIKLPDFVPAKGR